MGKAIQSTMFGVDPIPKSKKRAPTMAETLAFFSAQRRCEGLVPVRVAREVLQCSRQYVYELIDNGTLCVQYHFGQKFIEGRSFFELMEKRGQLEGMSVSEIIKRSHAGMEKIKKGEVA